MLGQILNQTVDALKKGGKRALDDSIGFSTRGSGGFSKANASKPRASGFGAEESALKKEFDDSVGFSSRKSGGFSEPREVTPFRPDEMDSGITEYIQKDFANTIGTALNGEEKALLESLLPEEIDELTSHFTNFSKSIQLNRDLIEPDEKISSFVARNAIQGSSGVDVDGGLSSGVVVKNSFTTEGGDIKEKVDFEKTKKINDPETYLASRGDVPNLLESMGLKDEATAIRSGEDPLPILKQIKSKSPEDFERISRATKYTPQESPRAEVVEDLRDRRLLDAEDANPDEINRDGFWSDWEGENVEPGTGREFISGFEEMDDNLTGSKSINPGEIRKQKGARSGEMLTKSGKLKIKGIKPDELDDISKKAEAISLKTGASKYNIVSGARSYKAAEGGLSWLEKNRLPLASNPKFKKWEDIFKSMKIVLTHRLHKLGALGAVPGAVEFASTIKKKLDSNPEWTWDRLFNAAKAVLKENEDKIGPGTDFKKIKEIRKAVSDDFLSAKLKKSRNFDDDLNRMIRLQESKKRVVRTSEDARARKRLEEEGVSLEDGAPEAREKTEAAMAVAAEERLIAKNERGISREKELAEERFLNKMREEYRRRLEKEQDLFRKESAKKQKKTGSETKK